MKVIVIGGGGYIGSHICAELASQGFGVVSVDNYSNSDAICAVRAAAELSAPAVQAFNALIHHEYFDAKDTERLVSTMQRHDVKGVIYAADRKSPDESVSDPIVYYQNNIGNLLSVLSAMDRCKLVTKLIYLSGSSVYDTSATEPENMRALTVDAKQGGDTPYAKAKQVCETLIRDACKFRGDLSAVILRLFSVAGSHPDGIIGSHAVTPSGSPVNAMCRLVAGDTGRLPVYFNHNTPDGTCIRDYVHVCDVARAVASALRLAKNMRGAKTFNVGRGVGVSLVELMDMFSGVTQQIIKCRRVCKIIAHEGPHRVADITSAPLPLWQPRYSLSDICMSAWNWHRLHERCTTL